MCAVSLVIKSFFLRENSNVCYVVLVMNVQGGKADGPESQFKGCASIIHFVLDSICLRKLPNMIYCDICSLQPMEIYVDDEAKLTLHGLVQVCYKKLFYQLFFWKYKDYLRSNHRNDSNDSTTSN